jgi:hypothetical protein
VAVQGLIGVLGRIPTREGLQLVQNAMLRHEDVVDHNGVAARFPVGGSKILWSDPSDAVTLAGGRDGS